MEFRILGPIEARHGDRVLRLIGAKERAVLAYLLLHANEFVPGDRLVDEIWAAEAVDSARKSLRVRISELRKAFRDGGWASDELIQSRGGGYVLALDPDQLDLLRFERLVERGRRAIADGRAQLGADTLRAALALWRGPPLADVADEPFAEAARARLEELRLAALELRIEAELAAGLHAEVVVELQALVPEHPLRERFQAQLMLALYRSGRQAEALESYRDARRWLLAELGLEPGPTLRSLEAAILRQDPTLDLRPIAHPGSAAPDRSILVLIDEDEGPEILELAQQLAREPPAELILARLVTRESELREATRRLLADQAAVLARGLAARSAAFTSPARGDDAVRLAVEQDVDLVLASVDRAVLLERGFTLDLSTLLRGAPCDTALLLVGGHPAGSGADGGVLAAFGGSENDWAAVELAAWFARAQGIQLTLLGQSGGGAERDASRTLARASLALQRALGVAAEPLLVAGTEGILAAAEAAELLVVGLSTRWRQDGIGVARLTLVEHARPATLLVRRGLRPGGLAPRESLTCFTWSLGTASS